MNTKVLMKKRFVALVFALILALGLSFLAANSVGAAVKETPIHGRIIVKYSGKGRVHLLNNQGNYIKKYAKKNSKWKVYAKAIIKGKRMYRIGKNTWILEKYAKLIKSKTASRAPRIWMSKNSEKGFLINTAATGRIIGNKLNKVFYLPTQKNRKVNSLNAVLFKSQAEAIAAGYKLAVI
ncbi:hypothetical protein J2Z60_001902 [Lactobacillus colini]|uniref:Uncharacterized protein n=1 Tax=Lactobacillus colini TaxID=1819254 RepID=A0ABS4MGC2_9LACO|nr:SLAP domain-containing protein [Lactobacillus colini]MBP2058713.1 hypothetical protein [Lactobacillus colini]